MSSLSALASIIALPARNRDLPSILEWIRTKLALQRQRSAQRRLVARLRAFDRHLLDDIDIDQEMLAFDAISILSHQNPHVLAASVFAPRPNKSEHR